jgi:uncharacterized membrane protein YfcA
MWGELLLFVAIGFGAQLVDGALGMAYGVTATTVLLSFGIAPATASASVHAAEVFTTAASGLAHWRFGNVAPALLWRLVLPGMLGGAAGAGLATSVPADMLRPAVSLYLLAMGMLILRKALSARPAGEMPLRRVPWLGLVGGFLDGAGGGGWGPLVTSSLVGSGTNPRFAIGSVNFAEFFVAATISGTFVVTIGLELWPMIAGLLIGGIVAAPLAAHVTRRIPPRRLMLLVGVIIVALSLRGLYLAAGSWPG